MAACESLQPGRRDYLNKFFLLLPSCKMVLEIKRALVAKTVFGILYLHSSRACRCKAGPETMCSCQERSPGSAGVTMRHETHFLKDHTALLLGPCAPPIQPLLPPNTHVFKPCQSAHTHQGHREPTTFAYPMSQQHSSKLLPESPFNRQAWGTENA